MTVEAFLSRLRGVRRNRSGWQAVCPGHDDRSPSLSIGERNGRILLHCFAGCTAEEVARALGLTMRDLFAGSGEERAPRPQIVRRVERQIANLRARLTPSDRERPVTIVLADRANPDPAIARALALSVEGEICQLAFPEEL